MFLVIVACEDSSRSTSPAPPSVIDIKVNFNDGDEGWIAGFADYSDGTAPDDLSWGSRDLPDPLSGSGYYLAGNNYSDDLFIYTKKKFSGFSPDTRYQVDLEISIATDVPSGCMGAGGAPGESVWIFAGASGIEPQTVLESNGDYRMNIDRGNQAESGNQALNMGDISTSVKDCSDWMFEAKNLKGSSRLEVVSDSKGDIWIMIGMDSGYEAFSKVYLVSASASFRPLP